MIADPFRVIHLPGGVVIDLTGQANRIEQAINDQRLLPLAQGFLSRGLMADAAALLTYAVRYCPDQAGRTVQTAVNLVAQYDDVAFATLVFSAIAAEPVVSPEMLSAALGSVLLARPLQKAAYRAAGLPFPAADDSSLDTGDVSEETEGGLLDGRNAGDVLGGSLLPEVLRIGGGSAGSGVTNDPPNADEPGSDGGAS